MKVRDAIRLIESDGWRFHSQKGSHRQYVHPIKPGHVTIPGKLVTISLGAHSTAFLNRRRSILNRTFMKQYAVIIEQIPDSNYSAYVPDLPGCISTGDTLDEVRRNIRE